MARNLADTGAWSHQGTKTGGTFWQPSGGLPSLSYGAGEHRNSGRFGAIDSHGKIGRTRSRRNRSRRRRGSNHAFIGRSFLPATAEGNLRPAFGPLRSRQSGVTDAARHRNGWHAPPYTLRLWNGGEVGLRSGGARTDNYQWLCARAWPRPPSRSDHRQRQDGRGLWHGR